MQNKSKNKNKLPRDYIELAILITLWLTFIGVFGNYITDILDYSFSFINVVHNAILILVIKLVISAVAILLLIFGLYRTRKKFKFYTLADEKDMKNNSFKALILPISTSNKTINFSYIDDKGNNIILSEEDIKKINPLENIKEIYLNIKKENEASLLPLNEKLGMKLEKWLEENRDIIGNWAVPLLIIAKNSKSLEHIRLIGTNGDDGSFRELYRLEFILISLFNKLREKDGIIMERIESFENFTGLTELLNKIEKDLEDKFNYEEEEIAFDITGGTKPVSIIGTFFTLKSRTPILYVSQKKDEFGKIKEINAIINIEPPE